MEGTEQQTVKVTQLVRVCEGWASPKGPCLVTGGSVLALRGSRCSGPFCVSFSRKNCPFSRKSSSKH